MLDTLLASRDFQRPEEAVAHGAPDNRSGVRRAGQTPRRRPAARFRGVNRAREHRLARKQRPLAPIMPYMPPLRVLRLPILDGVGVASSWKRLVVGGNDIAGYPCPFMARSSAGLPT